MNTKKIEKSLVIVLSFFVSTMTLWAIVSASKPVAIWWFNLNSMAQTGIIVGSMLFNVLVLLLLARKLKTRKPSE